MENSKLRATIIGIITVAICFFVYAVAFIIPVFLILPLMFNASFLPFYYIGSWMFGETNYFMVESTVLVGEFIFLVILCVMYFKKLIRAEKQREKFNTARLIVFFVFLQFMVHPIGFYCWLITYNGDHADSMILFYSLETFPYSGSIFIVFGLLIDLLRYRISKKNSA